MWVSQSEAARQVGVTKQRINKLVEQDRLKTNDRRQVNLQEVLRVYQKGLDPSWTESPLVRSAAPPRDEAHAGGMPEDEGGTNEYREARTQREKIQTERAQFELDVQRGKYLPKQDVLDAMVASGRRMRQMLDAVTEWADELAAGSAGGAAELRRILKTKVRKLEQEMADAISLRGADEDDEQAHDGDRPAH